HPQPARDGREAEQRLEERGPLEVRMTQEGGRNADTEQQTDPLGCDERETEILRHVDDPRDADHGDRREMHAQEPLEYAAHLLPAPVSRIEAARDAPSPGARAAAWTAQADEPRGGLGLSRDAARRNRSSAATRAPRPPRRNAASYRC